MYIINNDIITQHFDIFDNICIIDMLMSDGRILLLTYENHKLKEKEEWDISPAGKGIPGESIQGTYKAHKNVC